MKLCEIEEKNPHIAASEGNSLTDIKPSVLGFTLFTFQGKLFRLKFLIKNWRDECGRI